MHAAHLASLAAQSGGNAGKIGQLFLGIAVFAAVFIGILLLASLFKGHLGEKIQAGEIGNIDRRRLRGRYRNVLPMEDQIVRFGR